MNVADLRIDLGIDTRDQSVVVSLAESAARFAAATLPTTTERTPTMYTLDSSDRKTIRLALEAHRAHVLSCEEVRAVLAHYELIAPAAPVEQPAPVPIMVGPRFAYGQRVRHTTYGVGEVAGYWVVGEGDNRPYCVHFGDRKTFCCDADLSPVTDGEETPDQWQVGDRFRWADGDIGTIEAFDPDNRHYARVRWDSGYQGSRRFRIVGGTFPCTKLPPVETPAPEQRFQVGQRVRHAGQDADALLAIVDAQAQRIAELERLAADLTPIDGAPAAPAAPAWHVGQRVRWKTDGDLGTVVRVEDGYPHVHFDGWRDDNSMRVMDADISLGLLELVSDSEPAPLAIGDKVVDNDGDHGIIKGIDGDAVWVWYDDLDEYHNMKMSTLTRL